MWWELWIAFNANLTKCVHFLLDNADDSQPRIHISNHNNNHYHKNCECTIRNSHSTTMASSENGRVLVAPLFYAFPPSVVLPPAPLPSTKKTPSAVWMITSAASTISSMNGYSKMDDRMSNNTSNDVNTVYEPSNSNTMI